MTERLNITMWSGPRNLSTALMRSFGNRADVIEVFDEPFYASYLKLTNKKHPMFDEVISTQELNWKNVITKCILTRGEGICYQKHMVHHLLPIIDKSWVFQCTNCFLIRDPKEVISSFLKKWPEANFDDFGFKSQIDLFKFIKNELDEIPVVVDASDLTNNPEQCLKILCKKINISWDPRMLKWEAGLKPYDGIWAPHWYPSVETSTEFKKNSSKREFSKSVLNFAAQAEDYYSELSSYKI